jgi:hypothetical protein
MDSTIVATTRDRGNYRPDPLTITDPAGIALRAPEGDLSHNGTTPGLAPYDMVAAVMSLELNAA